MLARIPASMQVFSSLAWVAALALLVGGVWLPAGYIFGTDFPGPRHFAFPDSITSFAGLQLELALLNLVFPGEVVGKILIFGILVSAGLAAFHSVPTTGLVPRAVASLVYVVNPFVYDRLAYGQLTVLAGYALLPLVASSVRRLLLEATMLQAVIVGLLLSAVAVLDVHIALIASVLVVLLVSAYMFEDRRRLESALRTGSLVLVSAAVALLTSIYWLIPLLSGRGPEAATLAGIGQSDLNSFSTTSDPNLGLLPNVLGLYGFWAEDTGRFASMKDFVPLWPVALGLMLMLAIAGAAAVWRRNENVDFPFSRAWLIALLSGAFLATVLGIGVADPHIAPVVDWLDSAFPPYRGMRDAQKWAAVLALVYAQLVPLGSISLMGWVKKRFQTESRREVAVAVIVAAVMVLPLYYGNGILYGMHRQILPSAYPSGWYAADRVLATDPHPGRAVFLPWHGYLELSFVRNANRVVASPAPLFFSVPVVASQDLEIPGIPPRENPDQMFLATLVAHGPTIDWAPQLAAHGFKYVLLARELDWKDYGYLDQQPGLQLVHDFGSIELYVNALWPGRSR